VKVLVTGATGKVGSAIVLALARRGEDVRAAALDPVHARALLPPEVECVRGDVTRAESIERAVRGCELVFNAMGLPEQWLSDPGLFDRVNAVGTETVVRAAARAGARRVVHTSTTEVFEAEAGQRVDESCLAQTPEGTHYERSKRRAEELALGAAEGVEVVIVNPSTVYGPGPQSSASLERQIFEPAVRGRRLALPALPPGGFGVVLDRDLAAGHLLAAERGRPGERYILSEGHVTVRELVETVVRLAGRGRVPATMPVPVSRVVAAANELVARLVGRPPLLARGQLDYFLWNARPDATKARRELGWQPTPLEAGLRETLIAMGLVAGPGPVRTPAAGSPLVTGRPA
jgi:dihydroflavonol-4-reductase